MEQCLIDNKVCPATNKRCKNCSLEDCKRIIEMIEIQDVTVSHIATYKKYILMKIYR